VSIDNKMTVTWVQAIKKYAEMNGGKFAIPKRDTDDYKKIKDLQASMELSEKAEAEKPKKAPKVAGKVPEPVEEVKDTKAPTKAKKEKKAVEAPAPVAPAAVADDGKAPVKAKKPRAPKVAPVAPLEPVPEAQPAPPKPTRVKKEKVAGKVAELVVEVKDDKAPVKAPRKSAKAIKEEKLAMNSQQLEAQSRAAARKALDETRLLIRKEPIVMSFD
jgi:hypothetical protein